MSQEDPTKVAMANVSVTTTSVLLQISTTTLANGVANTPYSATLSAFGGAQPYAWSVAGGSLPTGLSLNVATGVVSGTPTAAGTSNFTVRVTDQSSAPQAQTANLSLSILPQLSIITTALPSGSVGASYSTTLTETGGVSPYTWSLTSRGAALGLVAEPLNGRDYRHSCDRHGQHDRPVVPPHVEVDGLRHASADADLLPNPYHL